MARARAKIKPPPKARRISAAVSDLEGERPLKIGEAAKLVGVEPYVLRFWETQFPFLRPQQSRSRHRWYNATDIEILRSIKRLLHTEGYTIVGARKYIREKGLDHLRGGLAMSSQSVPDSSPAKGRRANHDPAELDSNGRAHRMLCEIREDLRSLHKLLQRPN
jgi:DNA-binding transcriptional MerR regulator